MSWRPEAIANLNGPGRAPRGPGRPGRPARGLGMDYSLSPVVPGSPGPAGGIIYVRWARVTAHQPRRTLIDYI